MKRIHIGMGLFIHEQWLIILRSVGIHNIGHTCPTVTFAIGTLTPIYWPVQYIGQNSYIYFL